MRDLIKLYKEMSNLTKPECAKCKVPYSCCSKEYCQMTIDYAQKSWGIQLESTGNQKLPLMGQNGCIAAPHLRPMCTYHLCAINDIGTTFDLDFDEKYFNLRFQIELKEMERNENKRGAQGSDG